MNMNSIIEAVSVARNEQELIEYLDMFLMELYVKQLRDEEDWRRRYKMTVVRLLAKANDYRLIKTAPYDKFRQYIIDVLMNCQM